MSNKIWLDGLFSETLINAVSDKNIDSMIISFDPTDDFFCPLEDALKLINSANDKLIKVVLKFDNTTALSFSELLKKIDQLNLSYDLVLKDYQLALEADKIKRKYYFLCPDLSMPSLSSKYLKGYIFKEEVSFQLGDNFLLGSYLPINEIKNSKSDFCIISLKKYESSYRNLDYQKLLSDLTKVYN